MDLTASAGPRRTFVMLLMVILVFAALPMISLAQTASAPKSLEGKWEGALGSGPGKLRVVVTISKTSTGDYSGLLNSVDQGAKLQMSNIALEGDKVHFELKTVGGIYQGTLSQDGQEIKGSWTQSAAPNPQPLNLTRQTSATVVQSSAPAGPATKPEKMPLNVSIPIAPTAFKANEKWHLAYELHISNSSDWDCLLTSIEAINEDRSPKSLAKFTGADLQSIVVQPGQPDAPDTAKLAPHSKAVVYMWVTVTTAADVPASITNRVLLKLGTYPEELNVDLPTTPADRKPVVVISPPLTGEFWVAANGPSNTSAHRRALIELDGRSYISQRFAIDWVELNPDGNTYKGDRADNKSYLAYGAEIHAVADGVVTEVKDGIPQNIPGENSRAVPITLETIGGNHVIMKIGDALYAFYAHMQPGSLRVKVGDQIHRGQILGLVGNTGNSTEPHLHFDICNASSMLTCEGLPYAFATFEVQGEGENWKPSESHPAPANHKMEIPTENEIVRFPNKP